MLQHSFLNSRPMELYKLSSVSQLARANGNVHIIYLTENGPAANRSRPWHHQWFIQISTKTEYLIHTYL